jgi:hypothetical protein
MNGLHILSSVGDDGVYRRKGVIAGLAAHVIS